MSPGYYTYRTTTDKLGADLNRIAECGDSIVSTVHVGGRDWVLVCIKAASDVPGEAWLSSQVANNG